MTTTPLFQLQFAGLKDGKTETKERLFRTLEIDLGLKPEEIEKMIENAPLVLQEAETQEDLLPLFMVLESAGASVSLLDSEGNNPLSEALKMMDFRAEAANAAAEPDANKLEVTDPAPDEFAFEPDSDAAGAEPESRSSAEELPYESTGLSLLSLPVELMKSQKDALQEISDLNKAEEIRDSEGSDLDLVASKTAEPVSKADKQAEHSTAAASELEMQPQAVPAAGSKAEEPAEGDAADSEFELSFDEDEDEELPEQNEAEELSSPNSGNSAASSGQVLGSASTQVLGETVAESSLDSAEASLLLNAQTLGRKKEPLRVKYKKYIGPFIEYGVPIMLGIVVLVVFQQIFLEPDAVEVNADGVAATSAASKFRYGKFDGESKESDILTKVILTTTNNKINFAMLEITPPVPPALTPEDLILGKKMEPLIKTIIVDKIQFERSPKKGDNSFIGSAKANAEIIHDQKKYNLTIPVAARAIYDEQENVIKLAIMMKAGFSKQKSFDLPFKIKVFNKNNINLMLKTNIVARQTQVSAS